jgi:hypothetical protein
MEPRRWRRPSVSQLFYSPFLDTLGKFSYLPACRICTETGAYRDVTLFNCFVMRTIPNDVAGIFESLERSRPYPTERRRNRL